MRVEAITTSIFEPGQNLTDFILHHVPRLEDGDVLIVTSKIVALAQGRIVPVRGTDKRELVRCEAERVLCESYKTYLTLKEGILFAAAGIDESNARESYVLWPRSPFEAARSIWAALTRHYSIQRLGVVLSDSRCTPLRKGVTGIALSYWGIRGIQSHIGKPDLFGRPLKMSTTNVVDSLASAAVLLMGESNEARPLARIQDAPVEFSDEIDRDEVKIPLNEDIFGPLFRFDELER